MCVDKEKKREIMIVRAIKERKEEENKKMNERKKWCAWERERERERERESIK